MLSPTRLKPFLLLFTTAYLLAAATPVQKRGIGLKRRPAGRVAGRDAAPATGGPQPAAADARPRLVVQLGHNEDIDSAVFSADGRYVVTGSWSEGLAVLWEVSTGREIRRFAGNTRDPGGGQDGHMDVAISHDARMVAATSETGVRVFDVATGRLVNRLFPNAEDGGFKVALYFSEDGRRLTAGRATFDLTTGAVVARSKAESGSEHDPTMTPDGRLSVETERIPGKTDNDDPTFDAVVKEAGTGHEVARLRGHEDLITAAGISPDGKTVLTGTASMGKERGPVLRLWDVATATERLRLRGYANEGITSFTRGGLVTALTEGPEVRLRDWTTGREVVWREEADATEASVSPDGRLVAVSVGDETVVREAATGRLVSRAKTLADDTSLAGSAVFSADGKLFTPLTCYNCASGIYRAESGEALKTYECHAGESCLTVFSSDGRFAVRNDASETANGPTASWLEVISTADGRVLRRTRPAPGDARVIRSMAFSPDDRLVVSSGGLYIDDISAPVVKVWDVATGRAVRELKGHRLLVNSVAWSPDGRLLATASEDGTARLWDAQTGAELRRLEGHADPVQDASFSPDGRFVLTTSADNTVRLCDTATGRLLARLVSLAGGDWVAVDPGGRFDANDLESIRGIHWVSPDDPLRPLPLEIFMREYYEPRLVARLLAGEKFRPVRALAELNRVQPLVRIASIEQQAGHPEFVNVTVEVSKASGEVRQSGRPVAREAEVHDLRLFRDGQLVGYAPAADGEVQVDAKTGRAAVTFRDVRLPRRPDATEVEFTAYAFNQDRVKSLTARETFRPPSPLPAARGRAYIISVGVNAYENEDWDLGFAADDARRLQEVLSERIAAAGGYDEVVRVPLISDYRTKDGAKVEPRVVTEMSATKSNFKAVLDVLAGRAADEGALKKIPGSAGLRRATPEDMVLVTFSSHGYADERGEFFLITSDTGTSGAARETLGRSLSSDELGEWLRDVDAGELMLVVDACHSAASVQGEGFKPGPMGSRSLGQLSYDKGMRILASTQADDFALESDVIRQGLLTYALTHDGIEDGRADFRPRDGRITADEWLDYGVERVPALHAEVERLLAEKSAGRATTDGISGDARARLITLAASRPARAGASQSTKGLSVSGQFTKTQQPALFDFARRRREVVLVKAQ